MNPPAPGAAAPTKGGPSHTVLAIAAAWLLSLGFDLFLHGGLLASLYLAPDPFLLPPEEAFRRIPFGYLTFLILTASLYWLLQRLGVRGAAEGFRHGLVAGFIVWGAQAIGLYSISTASWRLLAGWWIGQAIELGLAGAVLGAVAGGARLKRVWALVMVAVIICLAVTITLQSIGWAPAVKVAP
jgi:hypothetical protein